MASSVLPHAKLDWTISKLEKAVALHPEDLGVRLDLSRAMLSRGWMHGGGEPDCTTALGLARRVLQDDPTAVGALVVAGAALVGMERHEAAEKYLSQAYAAEPDRADLFLALCALESLGADLGAAVRNFERSCRLAPEAWETHLLLGRALMALAREGRASRLIERASYHLVRAMRLDPTPDQHPKMLRDMGICCMQTGRTKEAQRFFVRLRENPDHAAIAKFYLGVVAYDSGKYNNAIQHFRAYLREKPDDTNVLAKMAMAWFQMGDFSKARSACNKALLVDPAHLQARYALGCTLLEEGDPAEATKVFRSTLRDHPEHMPTYVEMVRTRRHTQDSTWLIKALQAEAGTFDRLPPGGKVNARDMTRKRISTLLDEFRAVGPSLLSPVLAAIDLTQDEGLRFQLWEAACTMVLGAVADAAAFRLREPARFYGPGLGLEALSAAAVLPDPVLTTGLKLEEADLKKAAVDRHDPAADVSAHRENITKERRRARAYQALLLLAIGVRRSTSGKALLARWAIDADSDLSCAAWAGLAMYGEPIATAKLAAMAAEKGATGVVDRLLSHVMPPTEAPSPRRVESSEQTRCSTCGSGASEVGYLMAGSHAVVCDRCVIVVGQHRSTLDAPEQACCSLCSRSAFEARGVYSYNGVEICSTCLDLSLGQLEREEVDRFLSAW
jgi:tetratricopeptide (TPR) repeat protein